MTRTWILGVAAVLALGACTIERTPEEYIDRQLPSEAAQEAMRTELADRLRLTAAALQRANATAAVVALAPAADVVVLNSTEGRELRSTEEIVAMIAASTAGASVRVEEPEVRLDAESRVAWFRTVYHVTDAEGEERAVDFTGVFGRRQGEWRLVQGHLSRRPQPEAEAAEAAAESAGSG